MCYSFLRWNINMKFYKWWSVYHYLLNWHLNEITGIKFRSKGIQNVYAWDFETNSYNFHSWYETSFAIEHFCLINIENGLVRICVSWLTFSFECRFQFTKWIKSACIIWNTLKIALQWLPDVHEIMKIMQCPLEVFSLL